MERCKVPRTEGLEANGQAMAGTGKAPIVNQGGEALVSVQDFCYRGDGPTSVVGRPFETDLASVLQTYFCQPDLQ